MGRVEKIREVQEKILETMKYIDHVCRENNIVYYIMGGTAIGAIRHGGFIPWDDDLDIFMTLEQYQKFKIAFEKENQPKFVLQEWKSVPDYLEYAKVRMNGTTFIEKNFRKNKNLHQGIYVDIMILHKVPKNRVVQKIIYYKSKFVTLYGLSQRNWTPKTKIHKIALGMLKILPTNWLAMQCYKHIYKYEDLTEEFFWCYWITKASFNGGLFEKDFFWEPKDIPFEDTMLMGSEKIKQYLTARYGDYMKLPSKEEQEMAVHAEIYDTNKDYTEYLR